MKLGRRPFLRGLGGIGLALPFLEYFAPATVKAAKGQCRYAFLFAGFSIGSYGNDRIANIAEGPWSGQITRGLQPLADLGVQDDVTLVSGLSIPGGQSSPPAGRPAAFHSTSHQVLSTGYRYDDAAGLGGFGAQTSDWVAADAIANGTAFPVLTYRAQAAPYLAGYSGYIDGIISVRNGGSGLELVEPVTSPRVAFESLFAGFVPPDPEEALAARRLLDMRKSVVDLVASDAERLVPKLGRADQIRMERHFDELRALEGRLEELDLPDEAACQMLDHPGDDPPIGDAIDPSGGGDYNSHFENSNGYSDEDLRAEVMTDLIHMAFTCDLSRVASFMITSAQCFMNMNPPLGFPSDLHEITHGSVAVDGEYEDGNQNALADCAAWHVRHFARLVQKLRDTESLDGSSLLDTTGLVLAFEGGWGFDHETGGDNSPHSTENMVMLVGGHAGELNRSPGGHLVTQGRHPAEVLNTVLREVGVQATLGEVDGYVNALTS